MFYKDNTKKILCFGDSNTFGYIPGNGDRYDNKTRWTGILKRKLAPNYDIIEAGRNNRNGFVESIDGDDCTGYKVLPQCLKEKPDIVILALGINDIQKFYRPTLETISSGLESMITKIKESNAKTIIIAPPVLNKNVLKGNFSFQFDEISVETSKQLPELYKNITKKQDCYFIDFNNDITVSPTDGLHYSPESHKYIADRLFDIIMNF